METPEVDGRNGGGSCEMSGSFSCGGCYKI